MAKPGLKSEEITETRARLRQRAVQLRNEIRAGLQRSSDESHARIAEQARDLEDDSFADLMVDVNLSDVRRDMDELRAIDRAMRRLSDGTYGICIDCGREIPRERLQAQPIAERDIECQSLFERTHEQQIGPAM